MMLHSFGDIYRVHTNSSKDLMSCGLQKADCTNTHSLGKSLLLWVRGNTPVFSRCITSI